MLACQRMSLAGRLDEVSLALKPGEVVAVVGPNGAGKSSLLGLLAGLLRPEQGRVTLDGGDLALLAPRERARAIGYLPQSGEVAWDMRVATLVGLGRLAWRAAVGVGAGATARQDDEAVEAALAAMDLTGLRDRSVTRISGGERARVLLARVLAGQPRWILADEPLAALDLGHAGALMDCLAAAGRQGAGVVVALHDLAMAMNRADRVVVLAGGRLVADDVPEVALTEAVIAKVWGVKARWLGEAGARALAMG